MAATAYLGAGLAGRRPIVRQEGERAVSYINAEGEMAFPDAEHRDAFVKLGTTTKILAQGVKNRPAPPANFATVEGESRQVAEAGILPILAAVAVGLAAGAAIGFVVDYAAHVIDNELARRSDERKLLAAHAQALTVIDRHVAREEKAGRALPLDDASRAVLGQLGEQQARLTQPQTHEDGGIPGWLVAVAALAAALALS